MKICILGWYGTETLGDRAILVGMFRVFDKIFKSFSVNIGSLYPFFTQRTIFEDGKIYNLYTPKMQLGYFDVKSKSMLNSVLEGSDLVVMGGGPIMDLTELEVIYYSFKKAKKMNKKTMLLGCGMGPLYKRQYIDIVSKILILSDLVIFRDKKSVETAKGICQDIRKINFLYAHDPAIIPIGDYINNNEKTITNSITINFRKFPSSIYNRQSVLNNNDIIKLLMKIAEKYEMVYLVPMHTFCIGGDDRVFLTELALTTNCSNVKVVHKPMNLHELFGLYANSKACIGMRYHSVVFQTLLNGNNYIFDYTDRLNGKIVSFLDMIDENGFYKERYFSLQSEKLEFDEVSMANKVLDALFRNEEFIYDTDIYIKVLNYYSDEIKKII